jgi:hypothetical protein
MKRSLLPATALVLVVTACGAGEKPAPQATEAVARVPSISVVVARRKEEARREARQLVREFAPPPGSHAIRQAREYGGVLRRYGAGPAGELVDVHRFWSVRKPLAAVAAFVKSHRPPGAGRSGASYGSNLPHYLTWGFRLSPSRYLDVTAVALPGRTVLRVDGLALWIYPRSPSEMIPPATREIVVTEAKRSTKVTDPVKVVEIRRWFDALPLSPPGIAVACPLEVAARITLSFRNASGSQLAHATAPDTRAWLCNPISFTIGGKAQKPLIDRSFGESFARRLLRVTRTR